MYPVFRRRDPGRHLGRPTDGQLDKTPAGQIRTRGDLARGLSAVLLRRATWSRGEGALKLEDEAFVELIAVSWQVRGRA